MRTKACSKCGVVQPLSSFSRRSDSSDGHRADCKSCSSASKHEYYQRNPEPAILRAKAWQQANPDIRADIQRKWRKEHPEKVWCHRQLSAAVLKGLVLKGTFCQTCGAAEAQIEAHHQDYSKPLEVMWLCVPCHKRIHQQQRDFERTLERKSA